MARVAGICRQHGFYKGSFCPECGQEEPKESTFGIRMPGDNRNDTEMDQRMDRANQRHIEDNWADYETGKKKLVVPKNRPKEFDPRQLSERKFY